MRVEVGAALAAAHGQAGEGVLEDLLEAEELDDGEVDVLAEPQAALVGAERRAELDAETAVDLDLAGVVDPRHAEHDLAVGLGDPLEDRGVEVLGLALERGLDALEDLLDRLVELGLAGVAVQDPVVDGLNGFAHWRGSLSLSDVRLLAGDTTEYGTSARRLRSHLMS